VGKKVQELTAVLGVVGIVEGKLGGGDGVPVTGVQEGEGNWSRSFGVEMWC
jgi:hypothetical protein